MSLAELLSFTSVAALLVMSPGPNSVLVTKTVPASGRIAGFANIVGFVAAFYLHGALSILGISLILAQSAHAFFIVKMAGACYLCWIGIKALISACRGDVTPPSETPTARPSRLPRAFAEGFVTNVLNPKVSMFYLAVFPQFVPHGADGHMAIGSTLALVSIHALLNAIWCGLLVLLLGRVANAARKPGFQRWLKGITGVVFLGFGAKLATLRAN